MGRQLTPEGIGVILLASGQAQRMGQNKLLLPVGSQQEPCIHRIASMLTMASPGRVLAVYQEKAVLEALSDLPLRTVSNPLAHLGQSEAIKLGVLAPWPETIRAFIFVMGDQPLLSQQVIEKLMAAFCESDADMAVPCVGEQQYSPVIFDRRWTKQLLTLSGDTGAKGLLRHPDAKVLRVSFDESYYFKDMDTPEAYQALCSKLASLENGGVAALEKENGYARRKISSNKGQTP